MAWNVPSSFGAWNRSRRGENFSPIIRLRLPEAVASGPHGKFLQASSGLATKPSVGNGNRCKTCCRSWWKICAFLRAPPPREVIESDRKHREGPARIRAFLNTCDRKGNFFVCPLLPRREVALSFRHPSTWVTRVQSRRSRSASLWRVYPPPSHTLYSKRSTSRTYRWLDLRVTPRNSRLLCCIQMPKFGGKTASCTHGCGNDNNNNNN